jgi:hypothetical protein
MPPLVSTCPINPRGLPTKKVPAGTAPARLLGLALGEFGEGSGGEQSEEVGGQEAWRLLALVAKEASRLSTKRQSAPKKGPARRKTRLEKMIFRR